MKQYLDTIRYVLENGEERPDRTGTGIIGTFGYQTTYDLRKGFPLVTTKDMFDNIPRIINELIWFIHGDTNIQYLVQNGCNIWNADAYRWFKQNHGKEYPQMTKEYFIKLIKTDDDFAEKFGDLGRIYGKQWTDFGGRKELVPMPGLYVAKHGLKYEYIKGINQLVELIKNLKEDPFSRRHIVTAWNPFDMEGMALPPCHILFQMYVTNEGELNCQMYQRSADVFLGVPFNIPSYALLTHAVAKLCGLKPGKLIITYGDVHIYKNHIEQVKTQLERDPLPLPKLNIIERGQESLTDFKPEDFIITGYNHHAKLTGKVSVGE